MKMKVEIVVPEWANWMAQDKSGEWCFYENKPKHGKMFWMHATGQADLSHRGIPPKDWTQELYKLEWS